MRDSAGLFELAILMFISATGRRTKQEQGEDQRKEKCRRMPMFSMFCDIIILLFSRKLRLHAWVRMGKEGWPVSY
jgi:hypothetical protein